MRIAYNNLIDSADTISATGSNSNWPLTNLQDPRLEASWRSLACDVEQTITFDAGSGNTFSVTCVVLSGHNLTNAATVIFEMDDDVAFGSVNVQETLTWRADHIVKFITGGAYRYMRFRITDAANTDGYLEIGRPFAGSYLSISPNSLVPFRINNIRNDLKVETDQHVVYGEIGDSVREFVFDFPATDVAMISSWRTVYDTVGKVWPIWFFNYTSYWTYIAPAYCTLETDLSEEWKGNEKVVYNITLRECN